MKTDKVRNRSQMLEERLDGWRRLAEEHQGVLVGFQLDSDDNVDPVLEFPTACVLEGFAVPASLLQSTRPALINESEGQWVSHPDWGTAVQKVREFGRAARRAEAQAKMTRHADERGFWSELWDLFCTAVERVVTAFVKKSELETLDDHQNQQQLERCKKVDTVQAFHTAATLAKELDKLGFTDTKVNIVLYGKKGCVLRAKSKLGYSTVEFEVGIPLDFEFVPMRYSGSSPT